MGTLLGTYMRKMSGGRVVIPAQLRRFLPQEIVFFSHPDRFLCMVAEDALDELLQDAFGGSNYTLETRRMGSANSMYAEIDSNGSTRIPAPFRDMVDDGSDQVVLVGNATHVELWSPTAWKEWKESFFAERR